MQEVTVTRVASSYQGPLPACLRVKEIYSRIEARAREIARERGTQPGSELEDWKQAESETAVHTRAVFYEDDAGYEVAFQVPGFETNEIEIAVTPLELGLHALSRRRMQERKAVWREFSEHEAYRRIHFLSPVDIDAVEATLSHGMLIVRAPKRRS